MYNFKLDTNRNLFQKLQLSLCWKYGAWGLNTEENGAWGLNTEENGAWGLNPEENGAWGLNIEENGAWGLNTEENHRNKVRVLWATLNPLF